LNSTNHKSEIVPNSKASPELLVEAIAGDRQEWIHEATPLIKWLGRPHSGGEVVGLYLLDQTNSCSPNSLMIKKSVFIRKSKSGHTELLFSMQNWSDLVIPETFYIGVLMFHYISCTIKSNVGSLWHNSQSHCLWNFFTP